MSTIQQPENFIAMEGQYKPSGDDGTHFYYHNDFQGSAGDVQVTIIAPPLDYSYEPVVLPVQQYLPPPIPALPTPQLPVEPQLPPPVWNLPPPPERYPDYTPSIPVNPGHDWSSLPTPVPEPGTFLLLCCGLVCALGGRFLRRCFA